MGARQLVQARQLAVEVDRVVLDDGAFDGVRLVAFSVDAHHVEQRAFLGVLAQQLDAGQQGLPDLLDEAVVQAPVLRLLRVLAFAEVEQQTEELAPAGFAGQDRERRLATQPRLLGVGRELGADVDAAREVRVEREVRQVDFAADREVHGFLRVWVLRVVHDLFELVALLDQQRLFRVAVDAAVIRF